jgi:UDP-glucuronate 4-epimerase
MKILVTGAAGFIGFHTVFEILKKKGFTVIGVDNLNSYYDVNLKKNRIKILKKKYKKKFIFKKIDISNKKKLNNLFRENKFKKVINLAAQAGVRYVKKNPDAYFESNIRGFYNIIELCKKFKILHLVSASTSSVYGANKNLPFNENNIADHPTQFYAATKRTNEIIAHSYSHMFNVPVTLLRFFTAYGPWGRPDMSLYLFVKNIIENKKINVFNFGNHSRDFTFVKDIVNGIILSLDKIPKPDKKWNAKKPNPSSSSAPFKILNIGGGDNISLMQFIRIIEQILKKKAKIKFTNFQSGDIKDTTASIKESVKYLNYKSKIKIREGVKEFINWYIKYKKLNLKIIKK